MQIGHRPQTLQERARAPITLTTFSRPARLGKSLSAKPQITAVTPLLGLRTPSVLRAESQSAVDYNSDQATHTLIGDLLAAGYTHTIPEGDMRAPAAQILERFYPALKEQAAQRAGNMADRALRRVQKEIGDKATLAHVLPEVLYDIDARRTRVPTAGEKARRVAQFAELLRHDRVSLAMLLLPIRDRNPAKNDGQLPDLGEADTLLRLWTLCKAMELAKERFVAPRQAILQAAVGSPDLAGAQQVFTPTEPSEATRSSAAAVVDHCVQQARGNKKLIAAINGLGSELAHYAVSNKEQASALILGLARVRRNLSWLIAGCAETNLNPVQLYAVRDAHRYTCFDTDSAEDAAAYGAALADMAQTLDIGGLVTLTSHRELEALHPPARIDEYYAQRANIVADKVTQFMGPIVPRRDALLGTDSREGFLNQLQEADTQGKVAHLFETILQSRFEPSLAALGDASSEGRGPFTLKFINEIYTPQADPQREALRQDTMWRAVLGAAEYAACYEASTARLNHKGLDDMKLLLPPHARLSIHKKPETSGHYCIIIGPSVHRAPWHGTASLRPSKHGGGGALDTRLSLEYKAQGYTPVFVEGEAPGHLGDLAAQRQPWCWLAPELKDQLDGEVTLVSRLGRWLGLPTP